MHKLIPFSQQNKNLQPRNTIVLPRDDITSKNKENVFQQKKRSKHINFFGV
jgi:hypothetical protein